MSGPDTSTARSHGQVGPPLAVVVCTHNPDVTRLSRVLEALRTQTLKPSEWELCIVDNASICPVRDIASIEWHPSAVVIEEPKLGLVHARVAGIANTRAEVIVFVDDDNVLDPTYLWNASRHADDWPILGAWGGQLIPDWEVPPAAGVRRFISMIGVREFIGDHWSNRPNDWDTAPWGAGMCVRRQVAEAWAHQLRFDPISRLLGVRGEGLLRCEDLDLAFTATDTGLGTGLFEDLRLRHVMPAARVQLDYLVRVAEGNACSATLLDYKRTGRAPARPGLARRLIRASRLVRLDPANRRMKVAEIRGVERARELVAHLSE